MGNEIYAELSGASRESPLQKAESAGSFAVFALMPSSFFSLEYGCDSATVVILRMENSTKMAEK